MSNSTHAELEGGALRRLREARGSSPLHARVISLDCVMIDNGRKQGSRHEGEKQPQ
jgi:hypothetical protein